MTDPTSPDAPPDYVVCDAGLDYLADAKAALDEAHRNLVKMVAPGIDMLLAAAQANALVAIAESLEALLFEDVAVPYLPTEPADA